MAKKKTTKKPVKKKSKKYIYKNIAISEKTHDRLKKSMIYGDTFDSFIERLLDNNNK